MEEDVRPPNQPNVAMLKKILRFLLPKVGTSLGPNPLLSLLCLDWANTEMTLGLEFENLWKAELTSSNIIMLFCDCFASCDVPHSIEVDLAVVEDLIIPAMQQAGPRNEQQLVGRARLHKIVNMVLESGHTLDWVTVYGGSIARLLTSSPDEELLERCLARDQSTQTIDEVYETQSEKVCQNR